MTRTARFPVLLVLASTLGSGCQKTDGARAPHGPSRATTAPSATARRADSSRDAVVSTTASSAAAPTAPNRATLTTPYRPGDPCWGSTDETLLLALVERARAEGREHLLRFLPRTCSDLDARSLPPHDEGYLLFNFSEPERREGICETMSYRPTSVAFVEPGGVVRWCAPLPEGLRGIGRLAVENHLTSPWALSPLATLQHAGHVVLRQGPRLFVLDGKTGDLVLEHESPSEGATFAADSTEWEAHVAGATCRGEGVRSLLSVCGDRILSFDGRTFVVLSTSPHSVVATIPYQPKVHDQPRRPSASSATLVAVLRSGNVVLRLTGTLYM